MLTTARSFLASHRDASKLVQEAEKFSVRIPLVGRVPVPPPDQLAFYGVLGALGAIGLIDWPVAVAIGVGQAVMARHFNDQHPAGTEPGSLPSGEATAAAPSAPAEPARATAPQKSTPRKTAPRKAAPRKTAARKATPKATKSTDT